jgi:hypothetical protein
MPFLYEFIIDNQKVEGEIGFSTSRKWEEALDEATLVIPFTYENDKPYKMFSLLNIEITEIDDYTTRNIIDTRNYDFIIYSDNVVSLGSYGYYKHQVNAIEYTAKMDYYMINNLSKSRSILRDVQARFETNEDVNYLNVTDEYIINVTLEYIPVKENYFAGENVNFTQVYEPYIYVASAPPTFRRGEAVIRTNATLISGTSPHTLSDGSANWVFPEGEWYIEYGFIANGTEGLMINLGFNYVYRFYIEVEERQELSMYDVINEIRSSVSKFGGIEDTFYYEYTRIFDIDPSYEDYLKSVQAPQIYLSQATARQMLVYALSFINALPRLELDEGIDKLTLERYNLDTGDFSISDVVGYGGHQNTNQIGTRNYQPISQALANNLDDTSIHTPSRSGYQQVRSTEVQLTAGNFSIKLPEKSPLYMPKKLVNLLSRLKIGVSDVTATVFEETNIELDLTPRWINIEEWRLKEITENFPSIEAHEIWNTDIGLRPNKVENLYWQVGDTEIKLSDIFGTLFEDNLIRNVVKMAIYEWVMLHPPIPHIDFSSLYGDDIMYNRYFIEYDLPSSTDAEYKDWRFRVEYITDERLVIKQDKEDLEQVSFYSEMKQNQEEALVNIVRQSRKGYGDLQRTGNMAFSFPKKHISLSEFYEVGMKDSEDYTITQIDTQWYNDHAIAIYHITKYHNRIQQATFVNQKYRPFDNFAKTVLDRHEHYGDYLMALPPDDMDSGVQEQSTKIYNNDRTVRRIVEILLGNDFGLPSKPSATVALIRTDGMLKENPESGGDNRKFIVSPLTSRGIKGGFAFTLGFQNNQVAGDGLVSETVEGETVYFNRAVRYTDNKGRFTRFGFAIMKDLTFDSGDYPTYPLIENDINDFNAYFYDNVYFWCGYYYTNQPFETPLIWNKDPMTNAQLTYQLQVLSYYMNLYIFGLKFFTENYMVREHESLNGAKLYLYTNGTRYEMFEDLFVKEGFANSITLRDNDVLGDGNIEYDHITNQINFIGISMVGITSWAIGIENDEGNIELLLACNEGLSGIKFAKRHIRPNVTEIGDRTLEEEWMFINGIFELDGDFSYVRGREVQLDIDGCDLVVDGDFSYVRGREVQLDIDGCDLVVEGDFEYYRSKNIGDNLDIEMVISFDMTYERGLSVSFDLSSAMQFDTDLQFIKQISDYSDLEMNTELVFDMEYYKSKNIGVSLDIGMALTHDIVAVRYEWQETTNQTPTVSSGSTCSVASDEGDIRCLTTTCVYEETDSYLSFSDETEEYLCTIGNTQTICEIIGMGLWICTVYTGTVEYSDCEICSEVVI